MIIFRPKHTHFNTFLVSFLKYHLFDVFYPFYSLGPQIYLSPHIVSQIITLYTIQASNFAFAMRSLMRKGQSKDFKSKVDADNDHAITELLSLVLTIPMLLLEDMTEVRLKYDFTLYS